MWEFLQLIIEILASPIIMGAALALLIIMIFGISIIMTFGFLTWISSTWNKNDH